MTEVQNYVTRNCFLRSKNRPSLQVCETNQTAETCPAVGRSRLARRVWVGTRSKSLCISISSHSLRAPEMHQEDESQTRLTSGCVCERRREEKNSFASGCHDGWSHCSYHALLEQERKRRTMAIHHDLSCPLRLLLLFLLFFLPPHLH